MGRLAFFPDPVEHAEIRNPENSATVRHLDCRRYGHCLDVADKARWASFACTACRAFSPISTAERLADIHPLINCMAEAFRQGWREERKV